MITEKQAARLWAKTEQSGNCKLWTGYKTPKGYGKINISGTIMRAHRVAYEVAHGEIPPGIQIDHTCYAPACINPDHLRATTHKQNQENRRGAGRTNKSGVRGVRRHGGRWIATVTHNRKGIYLGLFGTIAEAEAVVVAKRLELFTHNDADRRDPAQQPTTPPPAPSNPSPGIGVGSVPFAARRNAYNA